ncbi:MAG: hypothetical protein QOD03_56 [Verrucomicrobiota bacterium]
MILGKFCALDKCEWHILFRCPGDACDQPANGAIISSPANVTVTAGFAASGCTIAKVEFYENNKLLATVTTAPYSFIWNSVPVGTHTIRAVATDGNGRIGVSDTVFFTIQ